MFDPELALDCVCESLEGESYEDEEPNYICGYGIFIGVILLCHDLSVMEGAVNHVPAEYASLGNVSPAVSTDYSFVQRLGIKTGLRLQRKGVLSKYNVDSFSYSNKVALGYLQLPVEGVYPFSLFRHHFIFGLGPYFAIGVASHAKYTQGGTTNDFTGLFKGPYKGLRRGEIGITSELDLHVSTFIEAGIETQIGLNNINPYPFDKIRNIFVGLHGGYLIPYHSIFKGKAKPS